MRKAGMGLNEVKAKILSLKGSHVEMDINRGRKKIDKFSGIIKDVYPSVFTVIGKEEGESIQTFSYYDVLCGNVVIKG
ncbi:MAG: Veg family protein [Clostridia bacterium]|nr:Veg family protein [Clostridia bacterium]